MKLSWNSLKISIAGARLSHLVQQDKIWDHGSMIEQAKMIFFKLYRTKSSGNTEDLKKYLTTACYEKIEKELDELDKKGKKWMVKNPMIKEIAIIEVRATKNNKPDSFETLIKAIGIKLIIDKKEAEQATNYEVYPSMDFIEQWCFIRQGEWWLLDTVKSRHSVFRH